MQGVSNLHVRYPGVADMGSEGKMDPSTLPGMEGLRYEQTPLEKYVQFNASCALRSLTFASPGRMSAKAGSFTR